MIDVKGEVEFLRNLMLFPEERLIACVTLGCQARLQNIGNIMVHVTINFSDLNHAVGRNFSHDQGRHLVLCHEAQLSRVACAKIEHNECEENNRIIFITLGTDDLRKVPWDLNCLGVRGGYSFPVYN